jgi:hypothetical protein
VLTCRILNFHSHTHTHTHKKNKKIKKRCGVLMLRIIKNGMVKILSMETFLSIGYALCDCDSEKPRKPEDLWHDQEDLQSLLHQSLFNTDFTTNILIT